MDQAVHLRLKRALFVAAVSGAFLVARPAVSLHRELAAWLAGAGGRTAAGLGGAAGLALTWIAWQLHNRAPALAGGRA